MEPAGASDMDGKAREGERSGNARINRRYLEPLDEFVQATRRTNSDKENA